jgi:type IV secretory pathway TraG/TraD family ATPase VirD4
MSSTSPRSGGPPLDGEVVLLWSVIALIAGVVAVIVAAVHLAVLVDGTRERLPANPVALTIDLARGRLAWPSGATLIAAALAGVIAAAAAAIAWGWRRSHRRHVDRAARWMGRGADIGRLTAKRAAATAQRLGIERPGLPIGRTVGGGRPLYMGWEDVAVDVWGPRTGKTTSRAIPSILAAPGAVLATSNKRDVVDASRDVRARRGDVWVFDPQRIAGERPTWWWNPISYVTDEVRAMEMADVFALASRELGARTDAFFDTAGQNVVAQLLLAAALDRRELTQVHLWLSEETSDEPVQILTEHRYHVIAGALQAQVNAPEKQRGGVFGTAREICAFMTNREAMEWVTPPRDRRPQFDPAAFAASTDTLYSLSKEGKAGAGPLVTGLTLAVCEAAEQLAKTCPGGRLPVPMVAVLDEAANVCRWRRLPDLYSHYGSRGILLMTILQSWSQGVEAWGREGMRKLWSAATVKVYGGGVTEVEFLEELSKLIGEYDQLSRSDTSSHRQGRSSNRSVRPARILDVADLAAMPQGRIVVIASGTRPTLAVPVPWMAGPDAERVRASLAAHDPVNDRGGEEVARR